MYNSRSHCHQNPSWMNVVKWQIICTLRGSSELLNVWKFVFIFFWNCFDLPTHPPKSLILKYVLATNIHLRTCNGKCCTSSVVFNGVSWLAKACNIVVETADQSAKQTNDFLFSPSCIVMEHLILIFIMFIDFQKFVLIILNGPL